MSTPKELADKAKQQAASWAAAAVFNGSTRRVDVLRDELHATIDQLQAMAEARQGSGEPVAMTPELLRQFSERNDPMFTHSAPSAQQATGSGQVLTDVQMDKLLTEFMQAVHRKGELWNYCQGNGWPDKESAEFNRLRDKVVPDLRLRILAAATQAQPEPREQRLAAAMKRLDKEGTLPGMISAFEQQFGQTWTDRDWRNETSVWACAWRAALAAPTTGNREPLTGWGYSHDEERFYGHEATREAAVAAVAEEGGWVCRAVAPREFLSADYIGRRIEEMVDELLTEEVGEVAENFALKPEERTALGAHVIEWIEAGPGFHCWAAKDVERIDPDGITGERR